MIGRINIIGQIGDTINEDGSIKTKGVQLQDVVIQVNNNKMADELHVYINSGGGEVSVGQAIARYLSKLPNVTTIANELCGSIATEIHLAVPLNKRKIVAGTEYFIHNPLLDNVRGNSEQLIQAANHIKPYETAMLNMYAKATGLDKASLQGLMAQETSLTDEQTKALGFASEIIPRQTLRAVAFINKNSNNQNKTKMTIKEMAAEVMAFVANKEKPKAMKSESDKGSVEWASEGAMPEVGEAVTVNGEAVTEPMDLTLADGTVVKVDATGLVTEVIAVIAATEPNAEVEALKTKIAELEASKEAEIQAAKASVKDEVKAEVMAELKAEFTSQFTPQATKPAFNKGAKTLSLREQAEARKNDYRNK